MPKIDKLIANSNTQGKTRLKLKLLRTKLGHSHHISATDYLYFFKNNLQAIDFYK